MGWERGEEYPHIDLAERELFWAFGNQLHVFACICTLSVN